MKLSKIPKHIWLGVVLPLVLVGLGVWRLWPKIEEYRGEDERGAIGALEFLCTNNESHLDILDTLWSALSPDSSQTPQRPVGTTEVMPKGTNNFGYTFIAIWDLRPPEGDLKRVELLFYCAYPANYDWRHRRTIFIAKGSSSQAVRFGIDNGGKPVLKWSEESKLAEPVEWPTLIGDN